MKQPIHYRMEEESLLRLKILSTAGHRKPVQELERLIDEEYRRQYPSDDRDPDLCNR